MDIPKIDVKGTIWVTYHPTEDCQCWRDALCRHGLTWKVELGCFHEDDVIDDVHESLADAIRALYSIRGRFPIRVLRKRYMGYPAPTVTVFVMDARDGPFVDDHRGDGGGTPFRVIERKRLQLRSKVGDEFRKFASEY